MKSQFIKARIISRETHGGSVAVISLTGDGCKLPAFSAGAHIDIFVSDDITRQYSLCGSPEIANLYKVGILNDPESRGGSSFIYENFDKGRTVFISNPRNHFPLENNVSKAILIGGGIGITPLLSMAYKLKSEGKPFEIHYCVKTTKTAGFIDELAQNFADSTHIYESQSATPNKLDAMALFSRLEGNEEIYICGPDKFMESIRSSASSAGFTEKQIHTEYFSGDIDTSGQAFEVVCEQSGKTLSVAADETIADALKAAGIKVQMSCAEGVCGTCITDVLEGEPEHRDLFLSDEEKADNDQIAVCCSRAKSKRLVLDI